MAYKRRIDRDQVGVTAIANAISCYSTDSYVRRLYAGPAPTPIDGFVKTIQTTTTVIEEPLPAADRRPSITSLAMAEPDNSHVNPLSSRTFGTWNFAVGIVRLFAAFHIHEEAWYQMQMITNVIGLVHFSLEAFVYRTARPSGPWFAPTTVAAIGLGWSVAQYQFYVR